MRGSYLIFGVSVLFLLGVAVTYAMSVTAGHVGALWCFISYTGNFPVESCVFSLVLNASSAVYFLIVLIRFCQISSVMENSDACGEEASRSRKRLNIASAVIGSLGALGLSIIGCFQQRNFYLMHAAGVTLCISCTNTYFILQTYFSFTILSGRTRTLVKVFRLVVVTLSSAVFATGAALLLYSCVGLSQWRKMTAVAATSAQTNSSDVYKAGSILEWLLFLLFQFFLYSFACDFEKIALKSDQLIFLENA